ncbi:MAG: hypothetical protein HFH72_04290 [Lachnospiraceae bacterium]|jgi:hypothetical protein|nr:hypothetical protein [Lachnospiraceae bacterium]
MEKEILGLTPISEEELNDYYGGFTGGGCTCPSPSSDKPKPYNPNCCWHDCKIPGSRLGNKFFTAGQ